VIVIPLESGIHASFNESLSEMRRDGVTRALLQKTSPVAMRTLAWVPAVHAEHGFAMTPG
jgi:hypothetical protein